MKTPILLVDANAIAHQAKHAMELNYEGMQTGVMFGFLRQIIKISNELNTNKIFFFWDSSKSNRRIMFPEYKANRRKDKVPTEKFFDDQCYKQFNLLKHSLLPDLGFKCYQAEGFEADDIIATAVQNHKFDFIIVSGDTDLYQLLSDSVSLYKSNNKTIYSINDFKNEYNITPAQWIQVKAIAGCTTDNIPGLPNIGEITACKYLRGELKHTTEAYKKIKSAFGKNTIEKNLPLVKLPLEGTPVFPLAIPKEFQYSLTNFIRICDKYGFNSMLERGYLDKCKKTLNLR